MLKMTYNQYGVLNPEAQEYIDAITKDYFEKLKLITDGATQVEIRLLAQELLIRMDLNCSEIILMKTTKIRSAEIAEAKKAMQERLAERLAKRYPESTKEENQK